MHFTVEVEKQKALVDVLVDATEKVMQRLPGFASANIHRSLDGTKVAMYAQWRSVEDYQAMRNDPAASPYLQRALALAKFEPGMYELVETFSPAASAVIHY